MTKPKELKITPLGGFGPFEAKDKHYFQNANEVFHNFIYKTIEHVRKNVSENAYVTILDMGLSGLDIYADEVKASEWPAVPPFLLSYTTDNTDPGKINIRRKWREGIWTFSNLKSKVHVADIAYVRMEYDELYCCNTTFIVAESSEAASEFLEAFHRAKWQRNRHGACVLSYGGEKMEEFRKMSWDDIYLPNNMLSEIRSEIDTFFKSKNDYLEHGLDWKRGMMLAGRPGNGKTAICRAIATNSTVPVIYCALDNDDMFRILHRVERTIKANSPCIVIFEDADTLGSNEALRSAMLNLLDGLFTSSGVLTIASTNAPEKLDEAFTGRPSRFDSFYIIGDPEGPERLAILQRRLGKKSKLLPINELKDLCKQMGGLSAACVQEVAVCALLASLKAAKPLNMAMLKRGLDKMKKHLRASEDGIQKTARGSLGFAAGMNDDMDDW